VTFLPNYILFPSLDAMDVTMDANRTCTNEWLQRGHSDLPLFDPSTEFANKFDFYNEQWDDKSFNQFGAESYHSTEQFSPRATFSDSDDYFTLNHVYAISPTIGDTPALSPTITQSSDLIEPIPLVVGVSKRKRGRPQASARKRSSGSSEIYDSHDSPTSKVRRTPHNQVERKYREGLNTEMERLRLAIPATARWEDGSGPSSSNGSSRPSKAMVLACAIDYIKDIERQRDLLLHENSILRR
jgi:hypothetical protein